MTELLITGGCNCGAVRFEVTEPLVAASYRGRRREVVLWRLWLMLFGRNPSHAEPIGIRMGTFDEDPGIRPSVRQFVGYAAAWEPIPHDGLSRHVESRHRAL